MVLSIYWVSDKPRRYVLYKYQNLNKSLITKVNLNDTLLDKIKPMYKTRKWNESSDYNGYYTDVENPVVILQVMLCGDNQCLVEFVLEKDFTYE